MIGFIIVAHGGLGDCLMHCVSHVLGERPPQLAAFGVDTQDDPQLLAGRLDALVRSVDSGDGVIIFTDMYGATPSNVVCRVMVPGRVEGISGVSLPMLVRALTYRQEPIDTVIAKAMSGGADGILRMSQESCDAQQRH